MSELFRLDFNPSYLLIHIYTLKLIHNFTAKALHLVVALDCHEHQLNELLAIEWPIGKDSY